MVVLTFEIKLVIIIQKQGVDFIKKKVIIIITVLSVFMSMVGFASFLDGVHKRTNYNENSLICEATITNIKTYEDSDDASTHYHHSYYGKYTVDNKLYENIIVKKTMTNTSKPDYTIGQNISIRINKDNHEKLAETGFASFVGGYFCLVGTLLIVFDGLFICKHIREPLNKTKNEE